MNFAFTKREAEAQRGPELALEFPGRMAGKAQVRHS